MPTYRAQGRRSKVKRSAPVTFTPGAGNYNPAARPQATIPDVRFIEDRRDVMITPIVLATGLPAGYVAKATVVADNLVTFAVFRRSPIATAGIAAALNTHADHAAVDIQGAAAVADHAVHSHPFAVSAGGAGGTLIFGAALISCSAGAQVVNAGGVAGDGVRNNAAAQAHAYGAGVPVAHAAHAGSAVPVPGAAEVEITLAEAVDFNALGISFVLVAEGI